ncbi:MAG: Do family serine endopeptidase [Henriciella sp.]|nr:Do family serine endopeptidase [Henriciella sp.]
MRYALTAMCLSLAGTVPFAVAQGSLSMPGAETDQQVMPDSFSALSKRLMPAVVNITTQQTIAPQGLPEFPDGSPLEQFNEFFGRDPEGFSQQGSLGSGFVISEDGLIVTNNHVIEGADEINAVFSDGRTLRAELIGTDEATDVAVLKVTQSDPFPYVDWADSDSAEVGDWVMAIGNPFGFGGSVSVGIVSARNRDIQSGNYDDYIQTDAAINRGNSGGPLFNLNGEVLGVNTAIISPTGGSVGLGFSIPANLARQISGQIIEFGSARRGWFGVNVQPADPELAKAYGADGNEGVIITRIEDDGPASESDFEVGDLVLSFDGKPVENVRALSRVVAETEIGKDVDVDLVRDGRSKTVSLTLGELPGSGEREDKSEPIVPESLLTRNPMGVDFSELDEDARRRYGVSNDVDGVLVRSVSPRGPSFGKLQKGDVVIELGFQSVSTPNEVLIAIDEATKTIERPLLVRVLRGGQTMFFPITLSPNA